MDQCWICGSPANTGEHKIKKSDLQRVHGRGSIFAKAKLAYLKSDESVVPLQGPDSVHVKYKKVLCAYCNSTFSQPFDRAYERFISYVDRNRDLLICRRQFDFEKVFGSSWRRDQFDLYRYFIKALGCRISDAGNPVPNDIVSVFKDVEASSRVAVCFAVDEKELLKSKEEQNSLSIGHLICSDRHSDLVRYTSSNRYRWLLMSCWFNWGPYGPVGEPWYTDQQFICIGSYTKESSVVEISRADGSFTSWRGIEA